MVVVDGKESCQEQVKQEVNTAKRDACASLFYVKIRQALHKPAVFLLSESYEFLNCLSSSGCGIGVAAQYQRSVYSVDCCCGLHVRYFSIVADVCGGNLLHGQPQTVPGSLGGISRQNTGSVHCINAAVRINVSESYFLYIEAVAPS